MNQEFDKNEDALKLAVGKLNKELEKIYLGGGKKKLEAQQAQGKMTARERVSYLLDPERPVLEIGAFAGFEMYEEHGGCPGAWIHPKSPLCGHCQ